MSTYCSLVSENEVFGRWDISNRALLWFLFFFWRSNSFMDWQSGGTGTFHISWYKDSWINISVSIKFLSWFYFTEILKRALHLLLALGRARGDSMLLGWIKRVKGPCPFGPSWGLGIPVSPGEGTWKKSKRLIGCSQRHYRHRNLAFPL